MRTQETFHIPGLETFDEVAASLPGSPRPVHPAGIQCSLFIRILLWLAVIAISCFVLFRLWGLYINEAAIWAWTLGMAMIPAVLGFLPWALFSSYKKNIKSFNRYKNIYQNGVLSKGNVNTISKISGHAQDCHYVEHATWSSSFAKIRIDYTFEVDNEVKTGSMIIRETSARFLIPNHDICVLYLPDDPVQSMIYPVPGNDWFVFQH